MQLIEIENMWQQDQWLSPAWVSIDQNGIIIDLLTEPPKRASDLTLKGAFIPGFINGHSHAFQYLLAGLAEKQTSAGGDFWTWRHFMYQILAELNPDQLRDVASFVYRQMLIAGYTHVVEFHYLHNSPNGKPYSNRLAMSEALIDGALAAGIHLTLIPVYYQRSAFDREIQPEQKRFYMPNLEVYGQLIEDLSQKYSNRSDILIGSGLHSLRAASQDEASRLLNLPPVSGPCHIHVAEQTKEVEDCLRVWKKRPVQWLLDEVALSHNHHLVHATHLDSYELEELAQSQASVVLCPSTEANLGDGIFPLSDYIKKGGVWSIGSDSNVCLNPFEELRWLDYGQRLINHQRQNYPYFDKNLEIGALLCKRAWEGGAKAAGIDFTFGKKGTALEGCLIDLNHPRLRYRPKEKWLSAAVFSGDIGLIQAVIRRGQYVWQRTVDAAQSVQSPECDHLLRKLFSSR